MLSLFLPIPDGLFEEWNPYFLVALPGQKKILSSFHLFPIYPKEGLQFQVHW
jgi:hypothetical protein